MNNTRSRKRRLIPAVLLCAVLSALPLSAAPLKVGDKAPDFTLTLPDGTKKTLADYKGKTLLLHFWATWCPPCRAELPELEPLAVKANAQKDGKLAFLAVCISDTEKSRASFMKSESLSFEGGLDQDAVIARDYTLQAIPTSVLISPDGIVKMFNVGMLSGKQIARITDEYGVQ